MTITTCDHEPIHVPNAIQSHGALLVADVDSRLVTHASANLEEFLGRSPSWAIGRPFEAFIGNAVLSVVDSDAVDGAGSIEVIAGPGSGGGMLNLQESARTPWFAAGDRRCDRQWQAAPRRPDAGAARVARHLDAGNLIVRVAGQTSGFRDLPPPATQADALALLNLLANGGTFALDDLAARHPELIGCAATGSGALIMPFGTGQDDAIVCFRPELKRNVMWGEAILPSIVASTRSPAD